MVVCKIRLIDFITTEAIGISEITMQPLAVPPFTNMD